MQSALQPEIGLKSGPILQAKQCIVPYSALSSDHRG